MMLRRTLYGILSALVLSTFSAPTLADDPAFLSISVGSYDWNRQKDQGIEARLEYRHNEKWLGIFKPFVAVAATNSSDSFFIGAGVLADIFIGNRFVITPSFAPHYYNGGNTKLNLDYALEFRSQIEVSYRFDNRARLGLSVSHYSNASLGETNPGTESAMLTYSHPVNFFD